MLNLDDETNRYVIVNGNLYMTQSVSHSKWGDSKRWYFAYGLLELTEKYAAEVPDVDMVINGGEFPLSSYFESFYVGKTNTKKKRILNT